MRIKVQVVIEWDEKAQASVHEVAELERGALRAETLGLGLEEAKDLLAQVQDVVGPEQSMFIEGGPGDWEDLPRPDLPLTVGLDGGYVHATEQRSRREGWFEVIAGKSMPAEGEAKCFGYVQTYDTKPKRRLFELLKAQGMAANQQVTFLTDGGADVRELPLYLNPE